MSRFAPVQTPPPPLSPSLNDVWTDADAAFSPTTDMYASSPAVSTPDHDHDDDHDRLIYSQLHAHYDDDDNGANSNNANDTSTAALRRQRNRESMRRTRQRAKETLTGLRSTLAQLEAQYAQLMAPTTAPVSVQRRAYLDTVRARLHQLVQLRRALEAENGAVRSSIHSQQSLARELRQLLDAHPLDEKINDKLALLGLDAPREKSFTPLTRDQVQQLVASFCAELARVQQAARAQSARGDVPIEVFGWRTRRHVDAATNEMHFEFTKRFDQLSASEMTRRAWAQAMDVAQFRATERHLHIRRLEFLQHVSRDVKVLVREVVHPVDDTVFRTNYLTFRQSTHRGAGILIGMRSLNPPPDEHAHEPEPEHEYEHEHEHERVVWIDVSVSVELVNVGPHACEVCWRGRTNYKSPQYAAENAVKFLMGVVRWECAIVGPLITLR